jgi:VanZ family protein
MVAQIFSLGSLPFELFEPWDKLFHVLAFSALTLLLWIATDGRHPGALLGGVIALALGDELRQGFIAARGAEVSDFLAGALSAGATAFVLFKKRGSTCAESSRQ